MNWELEKAFLRLTESLPSLAQTQKDYYDELIKSGFEERQAVCLTIEFMRAIMGVE